jgi:DNA-binding LytR/AlgR family response regulator
MKLKCLIVDDEPVARKILHEFISEIDFLDIAGQAESPVKAMDLLHAHPVDIIFLDINMPKINGIDFLKIARPDARIIITTAYPEYAVQAYGLDVLDYLVKPIAFNRFVQACNKARETFERPGSAASGDAEERNHFFVKCNNQIEKVRYDELVYAEAMLNYVMLYTRTAKMMVYITLKSLEEQLPASHFIKVHKSFIVNIHKVKSIDGSILDMSGVRVAISQNLRDMVVQRIVNDKMIRR